MTDKPKSIVAGYAGAIPDILDAAESAGYAGVWAMFARLGQKWGVSFPETAGARQTLQCPPRHEAGLHFV